MIIVNVLGYSSLKTESKYKLLFLMIIENTSYDIKTRKECVIFDSRNKR